MAYIYKIDDFDALISKHLMHDACYLSIKRNATQMLRQNVAFYSKNKKGEGIFGFAEFLNNDSLKTSVINDNHNIDFINRNYFQIPVLLNEISTEPVINIRHLRHFPLYNKKGFQKPVNPFVLYWDAGIQWAYTFLKFRYSYDFCPSNGPNFFPDRYWSHYIHVLRERRIDYYWNIKLPRQINQCQLCNEKQIGKHYLEIHDTTPINFDSDFEPININKFIVLCPSCHKKEHLKFNKERIV